MAGFIFGNVGELNSSVTVQCFVYVVLFIMFFDAFVGVLEYFLQGSQLYHRMIQTIYKELMLMGIVSFIITMILALESYKNTHSEEGTKWIKGIEFAHILLFFLTFFFVGHAMFLMRKSIVSRSYYRTIFSQGVDEVLNDAPNIMKNPLEFFLFKFHSIPAIGTKERMELWLFHELFRDTYWLPRDFNFADYLSGCFDQYILRTIDRSFFTWIVLMLLSVLNYGRIRLQVGFKTCKRPPTAEDHRIRYLMATEEKDESMARLLGGTSSDGSSASAQESLYDEETCNYNMFRLFLFFGAILIVFNLIVVYIARLYRVRMFSRIGVMGTTDYVDFLKFVKKENENVEDRKRSGLPPDSEEMTTAQLKSDIQTVLDEDEDGSEEAEFKELAEGILSVINHIWEIQDSVVVAIRSTWNRVVRGAQTRKFNLIVPNWDSSAPQGSNTPSSDIDSDGANNNHRTGTGDMAPSGSSDLHSDRRDHQSNSKLSHLHRSTTRGANLIHTSSNGNIQDSSLTVTTTTNATPATSAAEQIRASEPTRTNKLPDGTVIPLLPAPTSSAPAGNGVTNRRRTNIGAQGGNVGTAHAQDIRAFLQRLDLPQDSHHANALNHSNSIVMRSNRIRANSIEEVETSSTPEPNRQQPTGASPNAATAERPRRSSIVAVQATDSNRRRNSVQIIHPTNKLTLVERYKLQKAQSSASYAQTLRRQHSYAQAEQLRQQRLDEQQKSLASASWYTKLKYYLWNLFLLNYFFSQRTSTNSTAAADDSSGAPNADIERPNAQPTTEELIEKARLNEDFHAVYVFGEPTYFIRAIEIAIMFNCLYMAFWLSNFITIAGQTASSQDWEILHELAMLIPIIVVMPCVTYISETASLLSAISELNLHVIYQVLCDTEDTQNLLRDFRKKLHARIVAIQSHNFDRDEVLRILFDEIDRDGSGVIDQTEFRLLLRHLKLKYSDDRFKRLFHAIAGDSEINFSELKELVDTVEEEEEEAAGPTKGSSHGSTGDHQAAQQHLQQRLSTSYHFQQGQQSAVSTSNATGAGQTQIGRVHTVEEEEKSDEEDEDTEDDASQRGRNNEDVVHDHLNIQYQRPSLLTSKLRTASSVVYSDTDSDEEVNNSGKNGLSVKSKRRSHRKSGRKRGSSSDGSEATEPASPAVDAAAAANNSDSANDDSDNNFNRYPRNSAHAIADDSHLEVEHL